MYCQRQVGSRGFVSCNITWIMIVARGAHRRLTHALLALRARGSLEVWELLTSKPPDDLCRQPATAYLAAPLKHRHRYTSTRFPFCSFFPFLSFYLRLFPLLFPPRGPNRSPNGVLRITGSRWTISCDVFRFTEEPIVSSWLHAAGRISARPFILRLRQLSEKTPIWKKRRVGKKWSNRVRLSRLKQPLTKMTNWASRYL